MDDATTFTDQLKQDQDETEEGTSHHQPPDQPQTGKKIKRNNANYTSTTDPDSRMAVKPGKVTRLNYLGQLSVDTESYVITSIGAFHADKRDSQCLDAVLDRAYNNLEDYGLRIEEVIADTNYSSSSVLKSLASRDIIGYIPNTGTYKQQREEFTYDPENDLYHCRAGKVLKFIGYKQHHGISRTYMSKRSDCENCPFRMDCIGKSTYKTLTNTLDRPLFDQMHHRIKSDLGKQMMTIRKSTVEPVIGTLIEYLGMRKVYTKGIQAANKCMLLAGIAYNLKKLIKYGRQSNWLLVIKRIEHFVAMLSFNLASTVKPKLNPHYSFILAF